MINDKNKKLRVKEECNNVFDTDEILWLLKGNEDLSAFDFVCKCILNVEPKHILHVFEYAED